MRGSAAFQGFTVSVGQESRSDSPSQCQLVAYDRGVPDVGVRLRAQVAESAIRQNFILGCFLILDGRDWLLRSQCQQHRREGVVSNISLFRERQQRDCWIGMDEQNSARGRVTGQFPLFNLRSALLPFVIAATTGLVPPFKRESFRSNGASGAFQSAFASGPD
jgi:hypothetical protein